MHGHDVRPEPKVNNASSPRELFKRFYFDCLTHEPRSTRHLITMAGADHIVIGTDNPFDMAPKGDGQAGGAGGRDPGPDGSRAGMDLLEDGEEAAR